MGMHYENVEQLRNVLTTPLLSQYQHQLGFARLSSSSNIQLGKGDVVFRRILQSGNLSTVEETLDSTDPRLLIGKRPRGYVNITDTVDVVDNYGTRRLEHSVSLVVPFGKTMPGRDTRVVKPDAKTLYQRFAFEVERLPPVKSPEHSYGCTLVTRPYNEERFGVMRRALLESFNDNYPTYQEALARVRKGHAYSVAIGTALMVRAVEKMQPFINKTSQLIKTHEQDLIEIEYRGFTLLTLDYTGSQVNIKVAENRKAMLEALRREKIVQF